MGKLTADFLLERLAENGVRRIYGYPGDGIEVAERLGAGIAKALLGKAVVPDDLPFVTGAIGLLGTKPSWTLMNECDTLLMVGSSFPYSEWLPKPGQARGVQIDIKGTMLNIRYPMELGLVGDAKETLKALSPLLDQRDDRSWRQQLEGEIQEWWRLVEERAMQDADPINPQRVFWELNKHLPPDAIESAWDQAFAADRPVVVDALCDPNVPPLPPHITVKEAKAFVSALRRGDPDMREVMTQSFKEKILEFLPGR